MQEVNILQPTTLLFSDILKQNNKKSVSLVERWENDKAPFKVLNGPEEVAKFNPYHDSLGRFTSGGSATSFTYKPGKGKMYDNAIAREKDQQSSSGGVASKPNAEQKERGHIPLKSYNDSLNTVKQELGCNDKQAKKYINSVASYTSENYTAIRAYQTGKKNDYTKKFSRDAKTIEDYIEKAPKWNDGTLYRGINVENGDVKSIFKPGTELDMQGTSSWSSDKGVSETFTWGSGTKVIFQCDKISKATSVTHISNNPSEKEVLVSKDTKYVTKKISKKGKYYYVYLDEITGTAKSFDSIMKFNPYHDSLGRFASGGSATSFTYKPGASTAHSKAIDREKEKSGSEKGFKGTLYHGSPNKDIKEFDMSRAGQNTSSGEKLLFFTDSKQMADDFSHERLEGSSKFFQKRGKKGRVYEVDVEMKNPLDFRNLSDKDIDNVLKLDAEGLLTKQAVKMYANSNHQLLKAGLNLTANSLKELGYDGLIANTGKAGHNSLEYAVVDSKQAKIKKGYEDMDKLDDNQNFDKPSIQIVKADEDKRLVFGWALVSATSDGEQIIDHQGDIVDQDELEEGAYQYVLNFRDAGEEHISSLRKKARMVESVVFTEEKLQAMGIPQGTVPYGWWIGFYVDDDDTWEKIKDGTYSMFSIEGKAVREPVNEPLTKSEYEPSETVAKTFSEVLKFNPYHDRLGRFASANGAASMTIRTSSKLWQNAADKAIAREKERTAAMAASEQPKKKKTIKHPKEKVKSYSDVKNKNDFVDCVEHRHNFKLNNDKSDSYNRKRDILYTQIPKEKKNGILSDFNKNGIRYEQHLGDNYWIYYKSGKVSKSFNEVLEDVEKFNPYHDRLGRFTTGGGFMASGYTGDKSHQAVTFSANPNIKAIKKMNQSEDEELESENGTVDL